VETQNCMNIAWEWSSQLHRRKFCTRRIPTFWKEYTRDNRKNKKLLTIMYGKSR